MDDEYFSVAEDNTITSPTATATVSGEEHLTTDIEDHYIDTIYVHVLAGIACFGVSFNLVVLWVWSAPHHTYVPTTHLFKALAVADILYLIFWFPFRVVNKDTALDQSKHYLRLFLATLTLGNRKLGLLLTLSLAAVRAILIFQPEHAARLLSRNRLRLLLLELMTFSLGMQGFWCAYDVLGPYKREGQHAVLLSVRTWVDYVAPSSLQIALMVVVLWKLWQKTASATFIEMSQGMNTSQSMEGSLTFRKTRRVIYVVAVMCGTSFFAYQMPALLDFAFDINTTLKEYHNIVIFVEHLFGFLNGTVNIFFYMLIRKFREAFAKQTTKLITTLQVMFCYGYGMQSSKTQDSSSKR